MTFPFLTRLGKLEASIRDVLVDGDRTRFSDERWFQIVAALDCIGDGVVALRSYEKHGFGGRQGERYLRLFGLLQCVFMQQDSIRFLGKQVARAEISPAKTDAWSKVRELRNRIGGHPAERGGAVARASIRDNQLLVIHWANASKSEHIKIRDWVSDYVREAAGYLEKVCETVKGTTS